MIRHFRRLRLNVISVLLDVGGVHIVGELSVQALAANDRGLLVFNGQASSPAQLATFNSWVQIGNSFSVTIRYTDISRKRTFATNLVLGPERPDPLVTSVSLVEEMS